jgi:hypothetical protein
MTTTLVILGAYLAIGIGVALFAKRDRWIETIRWWHVVLWPVIPLHYGLVTLLFWMAGRNR